ncbi:MAG: carbon storage regulator [Actinomycetota bacterium]|nr:carbon storage regulator [Actinomycetota bacterium]
MLVLTRRANQSIMIGDDIVVTVLDVRGDQVRIGIKAPRSVDVHREEVFVALQRDGARDPNTASSDSDVIDLDQVDAAEPAGASPRE